MKRKLTNGQIADRCLKKMFAAVGEKYPNQALTDQPEWYQKRTWTTKVEDKFREWMRLFLKKQGWRKAAIENELSWFMLMYGWKTVD